MRKNLKTTKRAKRRTLTRKEKQMMKRKSTMKTKTTRSSSCSKEYKVDEIQKA